MCYYQKKNPVKTTINIKKENIISAGRVINIDTLVNKDFHSIIKNRVFVKPIEYIFGQLTWKFRTFKIKQIYIDLF